MADEATVFVVDDDEGVRKSLVRLFSSIGLRAEAFESAEAFLSKHDPARAGCVVADLRMPGMDGLQLQARLATDRIRLPVILISAHGEIESAVRAMKAGAIDFIRKPYKAAVLVERVRQALALDTERRERIAREDEIDRRRSRLTPREREVLDRMAAGKSAKEISLEFGLSRKTVDIHRAHVLSKMQVDSVIALLQLIQGKDRSGSGGHDGAPRD